MIKVTMSRVRLIGTSILIVGATLLIVAASGAKSHDVVRDGGTFRISALAVDLDSTDPALSYSAVSGALLRTTCANLFNYPDKPPPEGLVVKPEVANGYPRVSDHGKTLTFVIRPGFKFNTGAPLKADAFVQAINRVLSPAMQSPGVKYVQEIVGAQDVLSGRSETASGVRARGNKLIIRFTRPVRDFPARRSRSSRREFATIRAPDPTTSTSTSPASES